MNTRLRGRWLPLVKTTVLLAVGWFVSGILLLILIAGDYERPEDRPAGWVEAVQRVLAGVWLLSPLIAVALLLAVRRQRRKRDAGSDTQVPFSLGFGGLTRHLETARYRSGGRDRRGRAIRHVVLRVRGPHLLKQTFLHSSDANFDDYGNPYWCGEGLDPLLGDHWGL